MPGPLSVFNAVKVLNVWVNSIVQMNVQPLQREEYEPNVSKAPGVINMSIGLISVLVCIHSLLLS
jgi:hypothetical protein